MNPHPIQFEAGRQHCRLVAGHTLIEMMFAMGVLVMVVMALLAAHLMGMREQQWVESKSGASDTSRRLLNQLPVDIRSSKMWFVGAMAGTNFSIITNSSQGTALRLFETTNGSSAITYYYDLANSGSSDGHLVRFTSSNSTPVIVASNLVNWLGNGYTFNVEDYNGSPATNDADSKSYKCIIHVMLQFCQFQYPLTAVGTNGLYDYYKIEFKVTPHLPE
jgi:type II secretory pathway component PulJ